MLHAPEGFEERCRRVEAVTAADIQRVARATFTRENLLGVFVGPQGTRARRELERAVDGAELPEG